MNEDLISRSALLEKLGERARKYEYSECTELTIYEDMHEVKTAPAMDAVSKEEYEHLLKIATKMHTWIFLNTFDELAVYDELGLTDEDNALLGYGGKFVIEEKEG